MVDNHSTESPDEVITSLHEYSELELSTVSSINVNWKESNLSKKNLGEKRTVSNVKDVPPVAKRKVRKVYFAALVVLLNPLCVGYATVYSSTATDDMQHRKGSAVKPNSMEISWIVSVLSLGALLGGLIAGPLTEFVGRKGSLIISNIGFVLGWFTIAFAPSVPFIYCGRVIKGVCCNIVTVNAAMYLTEVSTTDIRGFLVASFHLFITIGVLVVSCVGTNMSWVWSALTGASMSVLTLLAVVFIPKSPRWLMLKGREQEALWTINYLQGGFIDATEEIKAIRTDIENQAKGKLQLSEFKLPEFYKPAILSFILLFFQQCSGVTVLLLYAVSIFKKTGSSIEPATATIISSAVLVAANAFGSVMVDRIGRKILLIVCGSFMAFSLAIFGGFDFVIRNHNDSSLQAAYGWIPVSCIVVCLSAYAIGIGSISWLIINEMSSVRFRGTISSVAAALQSTFQFVSAFSFNAMESAIHEYGVFWTYATLCAMSCFFTYFFLPETKGKPLEQIQLHFINKKREDSNPMKSVVMS